MSETPTMQTTGSLFPADFNPLEVADREWIRGMPSPSNYGRQHLNVLFSEFRGAACFNAIEIGSWAGSNVLHMLEGIKLFASPSKIRVFCVDNWLGSPSDVTGVIAGKLGGDRVYSVFRNNLRNHLFNEVFPLVGTSLGWARAFEPKSVDLIHIDANHDRSSVLLDMRLWWPIVVEGGYLTGHDFGVFPGVDQAIEDFLGEHPTLKCFTNQHLWWIQKPKEAYR